MEKAEFRNDSRGVCGAIVIDPGEKPKGVAVKPGETIWLTEEEQIATANAPRKAEDNPFVNGTLVLVTEPQDLVNRRPIGHTSGNGQVPVGESDQEAIEARRAEEEAAKAAHDEQQAAEAKARAEAEEKAKGAQPKGLPHQQPRDPADETGVEVEAVGDAPEGERAAAEEVGTPEAEPKPKPRARPSA